MGNINAAEFLDELRFCIKEKDLVKAQALLQFASDSDIDADVQRTALNEIAKADDLIALPLLEYLTKIDISDLKVQEYLYDLILDKAYGNAPLVIKYITENEKKARHLFLKAAGDLLLTQTAPVLQNIIVNDPDKAIRLEAVTSLGLFKLPEYLSTFGALAEEPDADIKRAAVLAISELGSNEAVDWLLQFVSEDETITKFAVEALAEIQNYYALEKVTTLLSSEVTLIRDTAIDQLLRLGKKATPILTQAFENAEADYLVHLVTTLGYIGDPAAVAPIVDIINTQPRDANIRQAAYEAMERIPSTKTAICLVGGLQDPVESVRMSAARAIDRNLSKTLVAGLKNVVRAVSQDAQNAVGSLIDAEAADIFNFLVEEESFLELAQQHVVQQADSATRTAFLSHMKSLGKNEFVETVNDQVDITAEGDKENSKNDVQIYVVDDSKMMLKLYTNKLTALGFSPVTFIRPEDAIVKTLDQKPDLLITDLNMPNISGLELTREVRRKYTRYDLPILMITTQSDFVEEQDGDMNVNDSLLKKSGINHILHKPFSDDDLKETIERFIK